MFTINMLIGLLFVGCSDSDSRKGYNSRLYCNAEIIEDGRFVCGGEYFDIGDNRSDEKAYSGKYSVKLEKGQEYGFTYQLTDVNEGERFIVRVKRHSNNGNGSLILSSSNNLGYFTTQKATSEKFNDGWVELVLDVVIPNGIDTVSVYVTNTTEEPAYFDDLEIIRMGKIDPIYPDHSVLKIHIEDLDYAQLSRLREEALYQGVINSNLKKEFPCTVFYEDQYYGAKIRFKGDWPDHLKTRKWSFRIQLDGEGRIFGKKTFSIQHPETRGFAKEWLIHQLLHREDVLTTTYDFIPVELNGKNLGLYAFEEHFEKQLLESKKRREGVIVKFDEELFWEFILSYKTGKLTSGYFPAYGSTTVKPFNRKKVKKSKPLNQQFILGRNLCEMYLSMHPDVDVYLDVESYAKYLAIATLANTSTHTIHWHNQRWYVNPVTAKLEPIAFDFSDHFDMQKEQNDFFDLLTELDTVGTISPTWFLLTFPFNNEYLRESYVKNLERMIDPDYLDSTFQDLELEIDQVDKMLSVEFTGKRVEIETIKKHVDEIRKELPKVKAFINGALAKAKLDTVNKRRETDPSISAKIPLRVYKDERDLYVLENSSGHAVTVYGLKKRKSTDTLLLDKPVVVGVANWRCDREELRLYEDITSVYYRMDEIGFYGSASVSDRPAPKAYSPRLSLIQNMKSGLPKFVKEEKDAFIIPKGKHEVSELLYIPRGKKLVIEAGARLNLRTGGGIICESEIHFSGNSNDPVVIKSDSKKNHGITVLNSMSKLKHVQFDGLNRLSYEGWELTGSVNFYECDVAMKNCTISNARSEDALNIIRSEFKLDECHIVDSKSDGFDSDFSKGTVSNCSFQRIGNDGVDFSGSQVEIVECVLADIGDKAISGGEESDLSVEKIEIDGAVIGVAAKDLSHVSLSQASISNCDYGYVAYTKKSEYGGGTIEVDDVILNGVKKESDIELNSTLILNGKELFGKNYSSVSKY